MRFIIFLLSIFAHSLRGAVLDITTVRRKDLPEELVCAAGTNALGYPLRGPNGTTLEAEGEAGAVGRCLVELGQRCAWEGDGWEARPGVGRMWLPLFAQPEEIVLRSSAMAASRVVPLPRTSLRVHVRAGGDGVGNGETDATATVDIHAAGFLLLASSPTLEAADVLAIAVARAGSGGGDGGGEVLLRCGGVGPPTRDHRPHALLPGRRPLQCAPSARPGDRLPLEWAVSAEVGAAIVLSTAGGELRLWRDAYGGNGGDGAPLLGSPLVLDFTPRFIAAVSRGHEAHWSLLLDAPALVLTRSGAAVLRSPALPRAAWAPGSSPRAVCVSFFAFMRRGAGAQLSLRVKSGDSSRVVAEMRSEPLPDDGGAIPAPGAAEAGPALGRWELQRVTLDLGSADGAKDAGEGVEEHLELHAYAEEEGSVALHSIMGCNPWGPTEYIRVAFPETEPVNGNESKQFVCESAIKPFQASRRACGVCENGGVCVDETGDCACPPGFIGQHCEEGCGEGHWGADCESHCGDTGCQFLLLCGAPAVGCGCATGVHGPVCDLPCPAGRYGVDCALLCGRCLDAAPCDRFHGRCPAGCAPGFVPPRCLQPYMHLTKPPVVRGITFDSATVYFSIGRDSLAGAGHPQFYQIVYLVEGDASWVEEPPRLLPRASGGADGADGAAGAVASHALEGLEPGRQHRVAVRLLDRDGGWAPDLLALRYARFVTRCTVPLQPIYHLNVLSVSKNAFVLSWRFKANGTRACDAEAFEVQLAEGGRHFSWVSTVRRSAEVTDLHPGETYSVRVRALTRAGPAPASPEVLVTTQPREPSHVRDLDFEQKSPTELLITWQPPFLSGRPIKGYRVLFKCLRLLACPVEDGCPPEITPSPSPSPSPSSPSPSPSSSPSPSLHSREAPRENPRVVLRGLRPHAQYEVVVLAEQDDGQRGPPTRLTALTRHTEPAVAPRAAERAVIRHDRGTLSVTWLPPTDCAALNGYPLGYRYRLLRAGTPPVQVYEKNVTRPPILVSGLRTFSSYELHVHQMVTGGLYSARHKLVINLYTAIVAPQVRDLVFREINSTSLKLLWSRPEKFDYQYIKHYVVSYECQQYLACPEKRESCGSKRNLNVNGTEKVLSDLNPYAEYHIEVTAFTGVMGQPTSLTVFTSAAAPLVAPTRLAPAAAEAAAGPSVGATWLTARWRPPTDCAFLRGPLTGYALRVLREDDGGGVLMESELMVDVATRPDADALANVTDLRPATAYVVRVAAVTSALDGARLISNVTLDMAFITLPLVYEESPTTKNLTRPVDDLKEFHISTSPLPVTSPEPTTLEG